MALLFFVLDLRTLNTPLLGDVKQCLLQLANSYAISLPSLPHHHNSNFRHKDSSIGLCYLYRLPTSSSYELRVAYSPGERGFSLGDFHNAINCLPTDSYLPQLGECGSNLFHDVDFRQILSNEFLLASGARDIERKLVFISSCLVGTLDSATRNALLVLTFASSRRIHTCLSFNPIIDSNSATNFSLQDAADKCVSVEFIFFEQNSSQLSDISDCVTKFKGQICDLENCSLNSCLPDAWIFYGLVKRWLEELKVSMGESLSACFLFKRNIAGSENQISCTLRKTINEIVDGFVHCETCDCKAYAIEAAAGLTMKEPPHRVTKCVLEQNDVAVNLTKVDDHAKLGLPSLMTWMRTGQISFPIEFNIVERTKLASLSEGLIMGSPYVVMPSACQEMDNAPEESYKIQLNNQFLHGLCRALHSLDQGLVCRSFCNLETTRETAFYHYYILLPSDNGLMLLRRLAGAEEMLPPPDVNPCEFSTTKEIDISVKQSLLEVELNDYNPMLHNEGFHEKLNSFIKESSQYGQLPRDSIATLKLDSVSPDYLEVTNVGLPEEQTRSQNETDEEEKKRNICFVQERGRLIIVDEKTNSPPLSVQDLEKPSSYRQLDSRTSKILERLEPPRPLKPKVVSPSITIGSTMTEKPLITKLIQAAEHDLMMNQQPMKPTFHRIKRKQR